MISLRRWLSRLTVSRLPFAPSGLSNLMTAGAVISEIGVSAKSGKTCSVKERQMSSAYAVVTESFLRSSQAVATFLNVYSVVAFNVCRSASRFSRVEALGDQRPCFNSAFPCSSQAYLGESTQAHVDPFLGNGMDVIEILQLRAIGSNPHLKAITISEDAVLLPWFGNLDFDVRKARGSTYHGVFQAVRVFQYVAGDRWEYPLEYTGL